MIVVTGSTGEARPSRHRQLTQARRPRQPDRRGCAHTVQRDKPRCTRRGGSRSRLVADSDLKASEGELYTDSHELSSLIGHPTTTLAAAIAAALPVRVA